MKKLFITVIALIFLTALLVVSLNIAIQTNWVNKRIEEGIGKFIKKEKLPIKVEGITISFPLKISAKKISALTGEKVIKGEEVEFKISILQLLFKKIYVPYLKIQDLYIEDLEKKGSVSKKPPQTFNIPKISLQSIEIENIHMDGEKLSLSGSATVEKNIDGFLIDAMIKKGEKNSLKISTYGSKDSYINLVADFKTEDISKLKEGLPSIEIEANLIINSSFKNLKTLIFEKKLEEIAKLKSSSNILIKNLETPINSFKIDLKGEILKDLSIDIKSVEIKNQLLDLKGTMLIDKTIKEAALEIKSKELSPLPSPLPISGKITGSLEYLDGNTSLNLTSKDLKISSLPIDIQSTIKTKEEKGKLTGKIDMKASILGEDFSISSNFQDLLKLDSINIYSNSIVIKGALDIEKGPLFTGNLEIDQKDPSFIKKVLFDLMELDPFAILGSTSSKLTFSKEGRSQNLDIATKVDHLRLKEFLAKKAEINLNIRDLFKTRELDLNISLEDSKKESLEIKSLLFKTRIKEKNWPYNLEVYGNLKDPFKLESTGFFYISNDEGFFDINSLKGSFFSEDFISLSPFKISWKRDHLLLTALHIESKSSFLKADILMDKMDANINIHADNFKIDLLSLNPLDISFAGRSSIKASLIKNKNDIKGDMDISLHDISITPINQEKATNLKGKIKASIKERKLETELFIKKNSDQMMEIKGSLPIKPLPFPYMLTFDEKREVDIRSEAILKSEDISFGDHSLKGLLTIEAAISNTIYNPKIDGLLLLKDGSYENYKTETFLENIEAKISSKNHLVKIEKIDATSKNGGKLQIKGRLNLRENYPFDMDLLLSKLNLINKDIISAQTSGNLKIKGDKKGLIASGNLDIDRATLEIPKKIKESMPKMDVKLINVGKKEKPKKKRPYPFGLNIKIDAKKSISIKGRGVDALLSGNLLLKGSYDNLLSYGKLKLVEGTYLFSGKNFKLREGSLVFDGNNIPIIHVRANTTERGVLITAELKGPLTSPELSFSSNPPLPISSIISLLMFGEELSGISGIQALQVASTVATISDGSGILDATKKNLGIDRIAVISTSPEDPDDPDKMALQVGKYVAKGVLVSYSQGTEEGSSNASVEVDMGAGFILQIETIQEEEQSRFTIKWSRNY